MTRIEAVLRRVADDLGSLGVRWALVGGLAVAVRAEPRLTRDVDVALATDGDDAAASIVFELKLRGYQQKTSLQQRRTGRLATVRLLPPRHIARAVLVDLLIASAGVEPEVVAAAEPIEVFPGLTVPVARAGHLIAMKLLAYDERERPQDYDDLLALLAAADRDERAIVLTTIRLIEARGAHRGRDLVAELERVEAALQEHAPE